MERELKRRPHPTTPYLEIVLKERFGGKEYVTRIYNKTDNGEHSGHYFKTYEEALRDFYNRK